MTYKLIWKGETIEEGIEKKEEAEYLQSEYALAFHGSVVIRKEKGVQDEQ